jgi:cell wall-associated NlpC family hydrolase
LSPKLTQVDLSANAHAPLAAWAAFLCGRPFAKHGRGPAAFDCWGVVCWSQHLLGRAVRSYAECYRDVSARARGDLDALIAAERATWLEKPAGGVGDVVLCESAGLNCHVAVLCGEGRALHALKGAGVVAQPLERRDGGIWLGAYRVVSVHEPRAH